VSDDIINELSFAMNERRKAERNDVVRRLKTYLEDLASLQTEMDETNLAANNLLRDYIVARLSKRDYESLKVFRNQLPPILVPKMDELVLIYEYIFGKPPEM
jgi:hypothetical protein